jgi:hypothetical protein
MRTRLGVLGVLAVCAAFAVALTSGSAGASQGPSATVRGASGQSSTNNVQSFAPPAACSPCLYYSGDFNAADPNADGLSNEVDALITTGAHVYTPVTPDSQWTVSGLLVNTLSQLVPTSATWEIRTGVSSGNGGTLVASGSGAVTQTATGRSGFGFTEYTDSVAVSPAVTLPYGTTYWINVTPVCAGCGGRAFESNVPPATAANHVGPANVLNTSYFNSVFFGANFTNANNEGPFPLFSFGVSGTATVQTLTVTKQVQSNSQDPGRWDLNIDGTTYASCVGNGGTTGPVHVTPGYHDVSEDTCIPSGSFTTYITCSDGSHISNSTDLSGVYVAPGGSTTCTIRNVRKLYKVG